MYYNIPSFNPEETGDNTQHHPREDIEIFSSYKTFIVAAIVAPLWFIANYSYNLSLAKTSVASNTIISSTSSLFTYLFSVIFLKERLTLLSVVGVLISFGGAFLIGWWDDQGSRGTADEHLMYLIAIAKCYYSFSVRLTCLYIFI